MVRHHSDIRAPFFFQTNQYSHTNGVNASLSHAVESVNTPLKLRFHATRMIDVVVSFVVCFLKADDSVQPMFFQLGIFFRFKRHYLDFQVREVRLGQVECTGYVRHAGFGRVFARYQQQVLEGCQLFDGFVFVHNLFFSQNGAGHRVTDMEPAIDA